MSGHIEKVTVRTPSQRPAIAATVPFSAITIPAGGDIGAGLFIQSDGTFGTLTGAGSNAGWPFDRTVFQLPVPLRFVDGVSNVAPRGICIAPDSAIAECDIWLNSQSTEATHFRVSPGNPMVGDLTGVGFVGVSCPNPMPTIKRTPDDGWPNPLMAWDASLATATYLNSDVWQFPLRLEWWYGCNIELRANRRAPYRATWQNNIVTGGGVSSMVICVDGRQRIELGIFTTNATTTLRVYELSGVPARSGLATDVPATRIMVLDDAGNTSRLLPNSLAGTGTGTMNSFSFSGNPMQMILVELTDSAGTGPLVVPPTQPSGVAGHYCSLTAWDY
jgi:hypothetical protein